MKIRDYLAEKVRDNQLKFPFICELTEPGLIKKKAQELGFNGRVKKPVFKQGMQSLLVRAEILQNCD